MARLNLRKVPDELHRALKAQAAHLGISLEERCLRLLSHGASITMWDGGRGETGDKTALQQKNSESSGAAARGPRQHDWWTLDTGERQCHACGAIDVSSAGELPCPGRRAGKSPIVVPKGKSLTEVLATGSAKEAREALSALPRSMGAEILMRSGPVDSGHHGFTSEVSAPDPTGKDLVALKKSREVPRAAESRACKLCGCLNGLHQRGCKGA